MVDKLTTKELDELYKRMEHKINMKLPFKKIQKLLDDFITRDRTLTNTEARQKLIRTLHGKADIKDYIRDGKTIKAHIRTNLRWSKDEENYILDNKDMPLQGISEALNRRYDAVRTKRQRLIGIKKD